MAEPYFRKGDVLVWKNDGLDDTKACGYVDMFGMGPFVCYRDIEEEDTRYNPIDPNEIERVTPYKQLRGCFAYRFQRDEFLTAAAKAVASEANDGQ